MEYRKIIDENGFVIDNCVIFINNIPQNFEMKDTYSSVTKRFDKEYIKPRWNGSVWEECATEEEIKVWKEKNKNNKDVITTTDRIDELEVILAELSMTLAQKGVL